MSSASSSSPSRSGRPMLPVECRLIHTGIRLGMRDRTQLVRMAKEEGISVSEYMRRLVWAHIAARAA